MSEWEALGELSCCVSAAGLILLVLLRTTRNVSFLSVNLCLCVTISMYLLVCGFSWWADCRRGAYWTRRAFTVCPLYRATYKPPHYETFWISSHASGFGQFGPMVGPDRNISPHIRWIMNVNLWPHDFGGPPSVRWAPPTVCWIMHFSFICKADQWGQMEQHQPQSSIVHSGKINCIHVSTHELNLLC